MTIFNIQIWGDDADRFMTLSCDKKKKYIKENTNQQNDELIEEYLKYAIRGNDDECEGCKKAKENAKPNITQSVSGEVAKSAAIGKDPKKDNGTDFKGSRAGSQKP